MWSDNSGTTEERNLPAFDRISAAQPKATGHLGSITNSTE